MNNDISRRMHRFGKTVTNLPGAVKRENAER
jgi:hypothetical protein